MDSRVFTNVMRSFHHAWAAQVLHMTTNPTSLGPDLLADDKIAETKFSRFYPKEYKIKWTVEEEQLKYGNGKPPYWALGIYWFMEEIERINLVDTNRLESSVRKRELYIVRWDWILQFPPHHTKGETENSSWERTLRYPRFSYLPQRIRSFKVKKGLVHLTEGVPESAFNLS